MTLSDKIKKIFAKAQDEALKMADAEEKPEEKKDDKAKDEMGTSLDELVQMCKDLGSKLDALKPKDAAPEEKKKDEPPPPEEKAKDEEVATSMEDRLKALEASVSKLLEGMASKAGDEEKDKEEMGDEDMEDDDFEETTMTGDTASRVEILAPGLKAKAKDAKVEALKAAYKTADGKKVIESITGGKAPAFESEEKVEMLFVAASELMKHARNSDLSKTKQGSRTTDSDAPMSVVMTADRMNEINAKFYNRN